MNRLIRKGERIIHVKLLDEGTEVWRPVVAKELHREGLFLLPAHQDDPEEQWEFRPGSVVHCEWVNLSGGRSLVAVRSDNYYPARLQAETEFEPAVGRVAQGLREQGVDVDGAVLADFFPDDSSLFFGLVVTPDGAVFQFVYDFLHTDILQGKVKRLQDISATWRSSPYARQIAPALRLAGVAI